MFKRRKPRSARAVGVKALSPRGQNDQQNSRTIPILILVLLIGTFFVLKSKFGGASEVVYLMKTTFSKFAIGSYAKDRVLCLVPVTKSRLRNAKALAKNLNDRCDRLMLFSDESDFPDEVEGVPVVRLPGSNLKFWELRRAISHKIWAHVFSHKDIYRDFDFFVKFGDPMQFFSPENFKSMLKDKKYDVSRPLYLGHVLEYVKAGQPPINFNYALGVYSLNRVALGILGPLFEELSAGNQKVLNCLDKEFHSEDDFAGFCMDDLDLTPADTRTASGEEYFLIFQAKDHYYRMGKWKEDWFFRNKEKYNVLDKCCAPLPVSFGNYRGYELDQLYSITEARHNFTLETIIGIQNQLS